MSSVLGDRLHRHPEAIDDQSVTNLQIDDRSCDWDYDNVSGVLDNRRGGGIDNCHHSQQQPFTRVCRSILGHKDYHQEQ